MGRDKRRVLPLPGSLSNVILPPWPSTILATMASPSPTPLCLVVTKGLKIVSSLSEGMPQPRSITLISRKNEGNQSFDIPDVKARTSVYVT